MNHNPLPPLYNPYDRNTMVDSNSRTKPAACVVPTHSGEWSSLLSYSGTASLAGRLSQLHSGDLKSLNRCSSSLKYSGSASCLSLKPRSCSTSTEKTDKEDFWSDADCSGLGEDYGFFDVFDDGDKTPGYDDNLSSASLKKVDSLCQLAPESSSSKKMKPSSLRQALVLHAVENNHAVMACRVFSQADGTVASSITVTAALTSFRIVQSPDTLADIVQFAVTFTIGHPGGYSTDSVCSTLAPHSSQRVWKTMGDFRTFCTQNAVHLPTTNVLWRTVEASQPRWWSLAGKSKEDHRNDMYMLAELVEHMLFEVPSWALWDAFVSSPK